MNNDFSSLIKESIEEETKKISAKEESEKAKINFDVIRKKLKNNFFAGFGIGLIVAAIAIFIFQPVTKLQQAQIKIKQANEMSKAEIIEKAKEYGMEFTDVK